MEFLPKVLRVLLKNPSKFYCYQCLLGIYSLGGLTGFFYGGTAELNLFAGIQASPWWLLNLMLTDFSLVDPNGYF